MALFQGNRHTWDYEVTKEGEDNTAVIYCEDYPLVPSIEDDHVTMQKVCDILLESGIVTKIILQQKRDYEYDFQQIDMLKEIARIANHLMKDKDLFSYESLKQDPACAIFADKWYNDIKTILFSLIKSDPVGCYVELKRLLRRQKIDYEKMLEPRMQGCVQGFMKRLEYAISELEKTKLIILSQPYMQGYKLGDREVYRNLFSPSIKPDFMFTKLMAAYPTDGEEVDSFTVGDTDVTIFRFKDSVQTLYHIIPPEFKLDEDRYELLDTARKVMAEYKPTKDEFVNPEHVRRVFSQIGHDLLDELAAYKGMRLKDRELDQLTSILVRYTIGFGLIEVLLMDEEIQDISINSPLGRIPIFLVHGKYDDCITNIYPTKTEAESWASKLRIISGRPLDEANPILDTELELPFASVRISAVNPPLNPTGLAFSFRRHRDKPWTLPLFIHNRTINAITAGLLSYLIDGTRTILISGTRSSGKSSLLTAVLVEIMRRYRIITVEDTLELPTGPMRKLGFNIQSLKVAAALSKTGSEMSAEDGIRSTLRLGDSALIVGEVRSKEALSLYEAMRVGAAANVVAGTIHGDSPYGIYDRVVNDIGVPKTSFKATDICVIVNPIRSADGMHKVRRVTQITEVRKHWENDPMLEGGFVDLVKYDAKKDELEVTKDLMNGDSEILKLIAGNIKDFAGNWDAVWDNIQLRAKTKQALVDIAVKEDNLELLEAAFVIKCNDMFHILSDKIKEETGKLDSDRIFFEWNEWLKHEVKRIRITDAMDQ